MVGLDDDWSQAHGMTALAIIPARSGSKGIPGKNFRPITAAGDTPTQLAIRCADRAGCGVVVSSDHEPLYGVHWLMRPDELCRDETPMLAVVQHVLQTLPGRDDQPIVLLQPTQPLRTPDHVRLALALLTPTTDSVVSVVEVPGALSAEFHCEIHEWHDAPLLLTPKTSDYLSWNWQWKNRPTRRQDVVVRYIPDGTIYAFWRRTVIAYGDLYGQEVRPLVMRPDDTCALDTSREWVEAERRLALLAV